MKKDENLFIAQVEKKFPKHERNRNFSLSKIPFIKMPLTHNPHQTTTTTMSVARNPILNSERWKFYQNDIVNGKETNLYISIINLNTDYTKI